MSTTQQFLHDHDHDDHEHHDHAAPVQAWFKTALLVGLGLYFVYIILSGNLTNYINVRFAWLSYIAAALFLLLGAASALRLRHGAHDHEHHHDHDHDHAHGTISWPVLAVIAIPLVLGTLIPSQPLGAQAVDGDLNTIGGDTGAAFDVPAAERNILDWVRAFNATIDPAAFNGQEVDVTGFVFRGDNYAADQFMVARFTISCCVADSVAIGVPVIWDDSIPADTWVRITGTMQASTFQNETRTVIQPTSVAVVERPDHPYLYP